MTENKIKKPELLAPAGDMDRLKAAVKFGADAVYLGGTIFGMRTAPSNFTNEQHRQISQTNSLNKRSNMPTQTALRYTLPAMYCRITMRLSYFPIFSKEPKRRERMLLLFPI